MRAELQRTCLNLVFDQTNNVLSSIGLCLSSLIELNVRYSILFEIWEEFYNLSFFFGQIVLCFIQNFINDDIVEINKFNILRRLLFREASLVKY